VESVGGCTVFAAQHHLQTDGLALATAHVLRSLPPSSAWASNLVPFEMTPGEEWADKLTDSHLVSSVARVTCSHAFLRSFANDNSKIH
jgi:hypothetical protein